MDIKLCTSCDGTGERKNIDDRDLDQNPICSSCKGTGRVYTSTYSYTVPYTTNKSKIYEFDSTIVNMIRKFVKDNS